MEGSFSQLPSILVGWVTSLFGANPSWDILLLICAGLFVAVIALWGRAFLGSLLVSAYISLALLGLTPLLDWLTSGLGIPQTMWGFAGILVIVVGVVFSVANYALGDVLADDTSSFGASALGGAAIAGMLVAFLLTLVDPAIVEQFSPMTRSVFTGGVVFFLWIIAPLVILGATRD